MRNENFYSSKSKFNRLMILGIIIMFVISMIFLFFAIFLNDLITLNVSLPLCVIPFVLAITLWLIKESAVMD
jgi:hypothetical protein